jgi:glutamine phosphoribosylpyrophosphate amidotransferase
MSSEDCSFPEIDHEYYGELPNGHLLFVGPEDALDGEYFPEPEDLLTEKIIAHPDCFEFIYLANRLSTLF